MIPAQAMTVEGVTVAIDRSEVDGVLLVFIEGMDTVNGENEKGPILRVHLNESEIWENPPYPQGDEK